ncbi:anaerobic ribonucleoside-triphosphate reductase activating protein, partial [Candidatus Magnetoovum chiemensis]
MDKIKSFAALDGITITGGEPFDQHEALYRLVLGAREAGISDIMLYSGYRCAYIEANYSPILNLTAALVGEPFILERETEKLWKGSDNQNMIILTKDESLRTAYVKYRDETAAKRALQIVDDEQGYFIIGIPNQKHSEAIRKNGF